MPRLSLSARRGPAIGFTLPEVLVVMGVIALLIAVLLPALHSAKRTADMAKSMSNLRQIDAMMKLYSSENREIIVPSQFNYQDTGNMNAPANGYPVKVRSDDALNGTGWRYRGTWADILWSYNPNLGASSQLADPGNPDQYRYDSPDKAVYDNNPTYDENPLRAAAPNSRDFLQAGGGPSTGPTPYGNGASEVGLPGFFAANNFFKADPLAGYTWYTNGQIKAPDRSMYLVDSFAGETIEPALAQFDNTPPAANQQKTIEVDFRYSGSCLMMFLDGHATPQSPWTDLAELQGNRHIKVQNLDRN